MDHVGTDLHLADESPTAPAAELPFEEAVKFLKGRVPVTKAEWRALEPKLRFRAFTVAKLSSYDIIERVRERLIDAVEKEESLAEVWKDLDELGSSPYYWETVYRTNIQTAYNAGRRIRIDKDKPDALEVIIIEDERTSSICRPLRGLVLPYSHPFWKTHWPPFHFNCRTTIRSVYKADRDTFDRVTNPTMKSLRAKFRPQSGFGGNPGDSGNYWMLLPDMFNRGLATGAINELNVTENVLADFDSVWKGYTREAGKGSGWVDVHQNAKGYEEYEENHAVAQSLAAEGRRVKQLPIHSRKGWKNPDYLIDGELWELETPTEMTTAAISRSVREGQRQAPNVVLHITGDIPEADLRREIKLRVTRKDSVSPLRKLMIVKGSSIERWTAEQVRAWK